MVDEGMNAGSELSVSQKDNVASPGEILLRARQKAGLTQEQVAKDLYMTVYKVKALETDDYNRLNSDTFARGYIRAYANLLKIDVVEVLAAYDQLMDEIRPQPVEHKQTVASQSGHKGAWHFLAIIGAFFIGLWLISVWFFDNHSDSQYVVAADTVSSLASTEKPKVAAPIAVTHSNEITVSSMSMSSSGSSEVSSLVAATAVSSAASVAQVSQASSQILSSSSSEQSSSASSKKAALDEVAFSFRGESWLEVSDSRGDVLATELQAAGTSLKLVGVAPFDVKLGNAPVVDIQLNGTKIDVIPLMGSNVLVMKIGN